MGHESWVKENRCSELCSGCRLQLVGGSLRDVSFGWGKVQLVSQLSNDIGGIASRLATIHIVD